MPSRSSIKIVVAQEECRDWSKLLDSLLAAVTDVGMESWRAEIAEIASSLDNSEKNERDDVVEERLRIQQEIERLQREMASLGDGS